MPTITTKFTASRQLARHSQLYKLVRGMLVDKRDNDAHNIRRLWDVMPELPRNIVGICTRCGQWYQSTKRLRKSQLANLTYKCCTRCMSASVYEFPNALTCSPWRLHNTRFLRERGVGLHRSAFTCAGCGFVYGVSWMVMGCMCLPLIADGASAESTSVVHRPGHYCRMCCMAHFPELYGLPRTASTEPTKKRCVRCGQFGHTSYQHDLLLVNRAGHTISAAALGDIVQTAATTNVRYPEAGDHVRDFLDRLDEFDTRDDGPQW